MASVTAREDADGRAGDAQVRKGHRPRSVKRQSGSVELGKRQTRPQTSSDQAIESTPHDGASPVGSNLDFPSFRILLLAKLIDRVASRYFPEDGNFKTAEWRVLFWLCAGEDLTVSQIADRATVDRAEVSRAAASLEARGLLVRKRNPADKRGPLLHVTKAGFAEYLPRVEQRRRFHESILANLSELERDLLDALLKKIDNRAVEMAAYVDRSPVQMLAT